MLLVVKPSQSAPSQPAKMHNKATFRALFSWLSIVLVLATLSVLAGKKTFVCKPRPDITKTRCNARINTCKLKGKLLKWVPNRCSRVKESGCQCDGFCGYKCAQNCRGDSQCRWDSLQGRCVNRITGNPELHLLRKCSVQNTADSPSPTASPSVFGPTASPSGFDHSLRRFSYFCLSYNSDLCISISAFSSEPLAGHYVQLSPYSRNIFNAQHTDKMRWDVVPSDVKNGTVFTVGFLKLEAEYPTLCLNRKAAPEATNLVLSSCSDPFPPTWVFDTQVGLLRLGENPTLCATVARCVMRSDPARSCIPTVIEVETNPTNFVEGSLLHARPCYDVAPAYSANMVAQLFIRELDCVAGCSPYLQNNGVCDEICNSPQCAFDKGDCVRD